MKLTYLFIPALLAFLSSCAVIEPEQIVKKGPSFTVNEELYAEASASETSVKISIWDQKAWLLNDQGEVLLSTDVSTGIDGRETPARTYTVLKKNEGKRSNRYGKYVDKDTKEVVVERAWEHTGPKPKGTVYQGILMPYWMRLTWYGIGMHVGKFDKRVRSSFGCIRVFEEAQPYIYKKTKVGTKVQIVKRSLIEEMQVTDIEKLNN